MKSPARALVIDDESIVRRSCAAALAGAEIESRTASGGAEGIHALEREACDVVFLDLVMPERYGMSVLHEIKHRWPQTEVVVFTGYPSVETAKEAIRLGAFDYLAKPVGADEIVAAARGAITRKQWALRDPFTRSIP
jgi:DNA-binding NtrC family response regulator